MNNRTDINNFNNIPNVGPATIRYLNILGIKKPFELIGQNPYSMYKELCEITGKYYDPCLVDIFISAVKYMEGDSPQKWWHYTEERKNTLSKKGANNMIAYCGMDCLKCEGYIATQEDSDTKRKEVAEKWTAKYHTDIKPEQINCNGCKSDGIKFFFTESICEIRKCNIEKSNAHCAACSEYKCEKLEKFIELAPPVGEALEVLYNKTF